MRMTLLVMVTYSLILQSAGAQVSELGSLSRGVNDIRVEHDGRSRRLVILLPSHLIGIAPIRSCFASTAQEAKLTVQVKDGALTQISVI